MEALNDWYSQLRACVRSSQCVLAKLFRSRQIWASLLLGLGIVLLVATAAAYTWMSLEQRRLAAEWRTQNLASAVAVPSAAPNSDAVTLLVIPKIDLQAAILDGTNRRALLLAPGHIENTAWPGDPGNAVIAAHRDSFFRHIHELVPGDDIYVRRSAREYRYSVAEKLIVSPDDIAVTYPTKDTRLTLITCYPTYYIGPAPKRLIVVAKLQSPEQKPVPPAAAP